MSYTYSLSTNFSGNLYPHQLFSQIQGSSISTTLDSVDINGDVVTVTFDSTLSDPDATTLGTVVSSYAYTPLYKSRVDSMNSNGLTITTLYTDIGTQFYYDPTIITNLLSIKILAKTTGGSYHIQAYDITNKKILATGTFTNTDFSVLDIGTLSNIPNNTAVIELHALTNNVSNTVTISRVYFYYF